MRRGGSPPRPIRRDRREVPAPLPVLLSKEATPGRAALESRPPARDDADLRPGSLRRAPNARMLHPRMTETRSLLEDRGDASELLDVLYAAAVEPEFWPTFGSLLGRHLGARVNLHAGEPLGQGPPPYPSVLPADGPDPARSALPVLEACSEQDVLSEEELSPWQSRAPACSAYVGQGLRLRVVRLLRPGGA